MDSEQYLEEEKKVVEITKEQLKTLCEMGQVTINEYDKRYMIVVT